MATMDVLGESITDKNEAVKSKDENIEVLDAISKIILIAIFLLNLLCLL